MRRPAHRWLLPLLLAGVGCFGGLSNQPLEVGVIEGRLLGEVGEEGEEAKGADALVVVEAGARHTVKADATGRFRLENIAAGTRQLTALGNGKAGRFSVPVHGGQVTHVEMLRLHDGCEVEIVAKLDGGGFAVGAALSLDELPLHTTTDTRGEGEFEPLPDGCYTLQADWHGQHQSRRFCLQAHVKGEVELTFSGQALSDGGSAEDGGHEPDPDAGPGLDGGRDGGHWEEVDGGDDHRGDGGVSRRDGGSSGDEHPCEVCTQDAQCGPNGRCLQLFSGSRQCAELCTGDRDCEQSMGFGFECVGVVCLPRYSQLETCEGRGTVGEDCNDNQDCRRLGLHDSHCEFEADGGKGYCTVGCDPRTPTSCPEGWTCRNESGSSECVR